MDLLTIPSADGVDSKAIQVEEALSYYQPPLATAKAISNHLKGRLEPRLATRQLVMPMAS
jgi:hypothetical protein